MDLFGEMRLSTLLLGILTLLLLLYYLLHKRMRYFKDNGIPHLSPVPLLGNMGATLIRRLSSVEFFEKIYYLNPEAKYAGFYAFHTPVFIIRDPELIKDICVKSFDSFPNHGSVEFADVEQEPLISKNLVALRGQRWREVRAVLSPSFTGFKIKGMFELITGCANNFAEFLAHRPEPEEDTDMKDIFNRYTNDVIASCAFGIKIDSMRDPKNDFLVHGTEATKFSLAATLRATVLSLFPKLSKRLGIRFINKKTADFFIKKFTEIIEMRMKTGMTRPDMLQLMMDSRGKNEDTEDLTIEDMVSQAFVFFFAGFETTSAALCFTAHEIAANPEIQERLQNEIDTVLQNTSGEVTYEAVNGIKYLEAVIYETLRMYPVAFATDRVCDKDYVLPPSLPGSKSVKIEKGTAVMIPFHAIQHDPKYYTEPEKFSPERFLGDNKKHLNSSIFLSFGLGPRMCIGNRFALLEIKVLFFYLLAWCNLKPGSKTKIPLVMSKARPMYPEDGFYLNIEPRNNPSSYLRSSDSNNSI